MRTIPDPMRYAFGADQLLDFKVLMIIYSFTKMTPDGLNRRLGLILLRSARRIVYADL